MAFETLKATSSDEFSPARVCFLSFPKQGHQLGSLIFKCLRNGGDGEKSHSSQQFTL